MPNFVKIGQTVAEISRVFDFSRGSLPPAWICLPHFWTTQEAYLVVFTGV